MGEEEIHIVFEVRSAFLPMKQQQSRLSLLLRSFL